MSSTAIVVTGANGFLGSHVSRKLVSRGFEVVGLVRSTSDLSRLEDVPIQTAEVDNSLGAVNWGSVRAVVHTATSYGRGSASDAAMVRDNVLFPLQIMERLPSSTPFLNTSTFSAKAGMPDGYLSAYNRCKRQLEDWLRECGRPVANLRLEHLFGPRDSADKFVPSILQQLLDGRPSIALSEGGQERDFVYVPDVVDAFTTVLEHASKLDGFNEFEVGRGESTSVADFVRLMKRASGAKSHLDFGARPRRAGEIQRSVADISQLQAWGWRPRWDLPAALTHLVEATRA